MRMDSASQQNLKEACEAQAAVLVDVERIIGKAKEAVKLSFDQVKAHMITMDGALHCRYRP